MRTDGMDVSKCHGLTVRAIFATRRQNRFRREKTERLPGTRGWVGWTGAGIWSALGCEEGEGGGGLWTPSYTLAARQTSGQAVHDPREGSWQARPARPDQIRSDRTRQTDFSHAHVCFVRGHSGRETLAPLPKLEWLQSPRDFWRFVPLCSEQDERRGVGRAWCLACPLWTGHEVHLGPSSAAVAPTRDDGYTYYAEDMCCKSDLACVGKEGSTRECGRPPRCADVDAAKLSSMQSAPERRFVRTAVFSVVRLSGM